MKLTERLMAADQESVQRINGSRIFKEAADRIDAQDKRIRELETAIRAISAQWDTPNWKLTEPTGAIINRARALLGDKKPEEGKV